MANSAYTPTYPSDLVTPSSGTLTNCTGLPAAGVLASSYGFSARAAATSCTNGGYTKIVFSSEDFDPNSNYDAATNYRYTAPVTGYYQIDSFLHLAGMVAGVVMSVAIYKNGSIVKQSIGNADASGLGGACISMLLSLAATDYIEIFVYNGDIASRSIDTTNINSHFSAFKTAV